VPNPLSAVGGGHGGVAGAVGNVIGTTGVLGGLLGGITGGGAVGAIAGAAAGHVAGSQLKNERIPFLVEGTTTNPKVVPDLSGVAMHMIQGQLGTLALPH
jgi:hypothetical protein